MTPGLSPNTQAILLLTAPLIAGRGSASTDLLSPGEYKRLARHLRGIERQPADLVSPGATQILQACQSVIEESRLQRLLGRGFLLSQVIERWQARAIWVVSRADSDYPKRLKTRLREDAPPVLYGCGEMSILDSGGLAVVGSRHVDDLLIDYTMAVGQLAAESGIAIVSGGAKGIDQAAMRGALEAGGRVCGVLADSLEKNTMRREQRNLLLDGQLVLISPYDPSAGFNVGHAMQRNKLIYALADASLVVSADLKKGGTWAGATEQLERLRSVPVFVRSSGAPSSGLDALRNMGAHPWPNPQDPDSFRQVVNVQALASEVSPEPNLSLFSSNGNASAGITSGAIREMPPEMFESTDLTPEPEAPTRNQAVDAPAPTPPAGASIGRDIPRSESTSGTPVATPSQELRLVVRQLVLRVLTGPMKEAELAAALDVSTAQAKLWLQRLVEEGVIEKQKKPAGYVVKRKQLFE